MKTVDAIIWQEEAVQADVDTVASERDQQRRVLAQLAATELSLSDQRAAQQAAQAYLVQLQAADQALKAGFARDVYCCSFSTVTMRLMALYTASTGPSPIADWLHRP